MAEFPSYLRATLVGVDVQSAQSWCLGVISSESASMCIAGFNSPPNRRPTGLADPAQGQKHSVFGLAPAERPRGLASESSPPARALHQLAYIHWNSRARLESLNSSRSRGEEGGARRPAWGVDELLIEPGANVGCLGIPPGAASSI